MFVSIFVKEFKWLFKYLKIAHINQICYYIS